MLKRLFRTSLLVITMLASGCAVIPPEPVVTGPLTAAPPPPAPPAPAELPTGSIYHAGSYGHFPLFEDRRPRNVGDIVTVVIQEKTNAAKNVATNTSREGNANFAMASIPKFLPPGFSPEQALDMNGANDFEGNGATRADNRFDGTITTTVVGVLPNGNLQIAGDKQMAINRGSEHLRFSGVVDPRSISGDNTVASTKVADARIEFRSQGVMDETQTMGWLQRFFLNVSPF